MRNLDDHLSVKLQVLLLKVDMVQVLTKALEKCYVSFSPDGKDFDDGGVNLVLWFHPICKSLSLICDSREFTQYSKKYGYVCFSFLYFHE